MHRSFAGRLMIVSVAALVVVATAEAQTTTGRMIGWISDQSGQGLPGATVTIASESLMSGDQAEISGEDGGFQFVDLPPGLYDVNVSLSGFMALT